MKQQKEAAAESKAHAAALPVSNEEADAKAATKAATNADSAAPQDDAKADSAAASKDDTKAASTAPKDDAKAESKADSATAPKDDKKMDSATAPKDDAKADSTPTATDDAPAENSGHPNTALGETNATEVVSSDPAPGLNPNASCPGANPCTISLRNYSSDPPSLYTWTVPDNSTDEASATDSMTDISDLVTDMTDTTDMSDLVTDMSELLSMDETNSTNGSTTSADGLDHSQNYTVGAAQNYSDPAFVNATINKMIPNALEISANYNNTNATKGTGSGVVEALQGGLKAGFKADLPTVTSPVE